jgi:hypothetical protein
MEFSSDTFFNLRTFTAVCMVTFIVLAALMSSSRNEEYVYTDEEEGRLASRHNLLHIAKRVVIAIEGTISVLFYSSLDFRRLAATCAPKSILKGSNKNMFSFSFSFPSLSKRSTGRPKKLRFAGILCFYALLLVVLRVSCVRTVRTGKSFAEEIHIKTTATF